MTPMIGPIQLVAYVTPRCTLKCEFCRRQRGYLDRDVPDVEAPILERVFSMFPSITGVSVAGFGEPLLADNIAETIMFCLRRGKNLVLSTNGIAYERHLDSIPWRRFLRISLSVNEIDRERYRETTGVDGLPVVIEAARAFREAGANVGFSFVIGQHNWSRMTEYMDFAKDHGARFVDLFNTLPHHGGSRGRPMVRVESPQDDVCGVLGQ